MINIDKRIDNLKIKLILVFYCVFIIIFREIDLIINPRLWAEEGKIFYSFAMGHSVMEIFSMPQVGYLTFFNSIISTLQAKVFGVEEAATVSTCSGLLIQLIPVMIIIFNDHPFWNTMIKKSLCFMIILVTPPELWLNTTNSHFIFGLITFLIMVTSTKGLSLITKWFFRLLLVLGNLSGPLSIFLTPVFIIKYYQEKIREKFIQLAIQFICASFQAAVIIYSLLYMNNYHRFEAFELRETLFDFFIDHFSLNLKMPVNSAIFYTVITISVYFIYLFFANRKSSEHRIFFISFIIIAIFSTAGSLNMEGSPRYGFVPTCILLILISDEAFLLLMGKREIRYIAAALIFVLSMTINAIYFKSRMHEVYSPEFPVWKNEVAKWRKNNSYAPKIHPVYNNTWYVEL